MQSIQSNKFDVAWDQRDSIRNDDYSFIDSQSILACYLGVWNEGYTAKKNQRRKTIIETNRKDFCFFWRYRPGMLFPAAQLLQEKEIINQGAAKDRHYTIIGLWIAATALV